MKYYEFVSENEIKLYDKGYVVIEIEETEEVDGEIRVVKKMVQISNPSAENLLKAGIKPLAEDERPIYDENTQYLTWTYENKESEIAVHWKVAEVVYDESSNA